MLNSTHTPISPLEQFIAKLNKTSRGPLAKPLTSDDIVIVEVKPSQAPDGTNTAVKINASTKSTYSGTGVVRIIRTDVSDLFQGISMVIDPTGFYHLVELLPMIERSYGLKLDHKDIINTRIPTELPADILLRMAPNNLALYGSIKIKLQASGTDLGDLFNELIIPEEMVELNTPNLISGALLVRHINFIGDKETLDKLATGNLQLDAIKDILNKYTEHTWVKVSHLTDFNLNGGVVVKAKDTDDGDRVVTVKLNASYCKNISGQLELYYG